MFDPNLGEKQQIKFEPSVGSWVDGTAGDITVDDINEP